MASIGLTNLNIIDTALIQQVFQTMEYPVVCGSTNLAEAWLKKRKEISADLETKDDSKDGAIGIYNINYTDKYTAKLYESFKNVTEKIEMGPLITVYSPRIEDVPILIEEVGASNEWFKISIREKAFLIERFAKEIEKRSDLICQLEILIRGILKNDTKTKALPLLVEYLQYYSGWAIKYSKENLDTKRIRIVASIISNDVFLANFGLVIGPALAAGYNIILQTEPRISIIAALIIELAESVGIPKGVIRLLPGKVDVKDILKCVGIDVISRFGELPNITKDNLTAKMDVGKRFLTVINGKSPMIVFNNADLNSACTCVVNACWNYQGMLPWSINTVIVQEDIFETFVNKLKRKLSTIKMSFAVEESANYSYPLLLNLKGKSIVEDLERYINKAKANGIEVFQVKNDKSETIESYYPTMLIGGKLFSASHVIGNDDDLPILTVVAFRTANEAVNLANNSRFGFGASVWTENISLANEVVGKLNVANIWINSHGHFTANASFTSCKQSGVGQFGGEEGFLEYLVDRPFSMPFSNSNNASEQNQKPNVEGIVTTAMKGQEEWNKMTSLKRSQLLRKVGEELNSKREFLCQMFQVPKILLENWIIAIYEGLVQINNLGSVLIHKSYELRSFKQAVGIVVVEDDNNQFLEVIVGALFLGNSVIILNFNPKNLKFLNEISKMFLANGIPKGVFNVILNCNENIFNELKAYKDIKVYFITLHDSFEKLKLEDCKRIYSTGETWSKIINATTITKNVWSNIGDSVL